jgi:hypothetical protein
VLQSFADRSVEAFVEVGHAIRLIREARPHDVPEPAPDKVERAASATDQSENPTAAELKTASGRS